MKLLGVELQDCGKKEDDGPKCEPLSSSDGDKVHYPTLSVGDGGWSGIKLDLDGYKAGQKLLLVAVVNVKEITERKSQSEGKSSEECNGTLEILEAGLKEYSGDKSDADSKVEDVARKINDALNALNTEESED